MSRSDLITRLTAAASDLLHPLGYSRRGLVFSASRDAVIHMIGLQSSQASTSQVLRATVNVAVWVSRLAPIRRGIPDKPNISSAHFTVRLGHLMPERNDKWWTCASPSEAVVAAQEISSAISTCALPTLAGLSSESDVLAYWRAGNHGGLTGPQRLQLLQKLEALGAPETPKRTPTA